MYVPSGGCAVPIASLHSPAPSVSFAASAPPTSGCLGYRHGGSKTPLYGTWKNMRGRCNNPHHERYPLYGERGISVCPQWLNSFAQFRLDAQAAGYVPGLEIDRIDVNGNYEPGNVRFTTRKEQNRNTRKTRWIEAFGERKTASAWTEDPRCSITRYALHGRLYNGWPPEWAIAGPPGSRKAGGAAGN